MSSIGTMSIGVKAPIIKKGSDLVKITADSVLSAAGELGMRLNDRDIVAVTEAVVAKAQNNYATVEQIAKDVRNKMPGGKVGLIFPILSRNRFALLLKAIAAGTDGLVIQFSFPSDEVGNELVDKSYVYESGLYGKSFTEEEFKKHFTSTLHPFTGIDYIELYKSIAGKNTEIIFSNDPKYILNFTKNIICADIHTRESTRKILLAEGARKVLTLADILSSPVDGSGHNPDYGVYGSNLATENSVKLFPRDAERFVEALRAELLKRTGANVECMVYGDGAFKDPVGGIWELADPVVSPAYTGGLEGKPSEVKLKYIADTEISALDGEAAVDKMKKIIREKAGGQGGGRSLGTTPRRLSDLLGSLCDLTTGSGDKGTPIVLIKNYFNNYAD